MIKGLIIRMLGAGTEKRNELVIEKALKNRHKILIIIVERVLEEYPGKVEQRRPNLGIGVKVNHDRNSCTITLLD